MWWVFAALAGAPENAIAERAETAWAQGAGHAAIARTEASERVARRASIGPSSLIVDTQTGSVSQRQWLVRVEQPIGLGIASQRWHQSLRELQRSNESEAQWDWMLQVHDTWSQWWVAVEIREHLEAHVASLDADNDAFIEAVREGLLAPADQADLLAESLLVQTELAESRHVESAVGAALRAQIGEGPWPEGPHFEHTEVTKINPWTALSDQVDMFPAVQAAAQRAITEGRHASALRTHTLPTVGAGVMWAPDEVGAMKPFANIGVTVPLQNGSGSEVQRARGEAAASAAETAWTEHTLRGALEVQAAHWASMSDQHEQLNSAVLQPLRDREDRLVEAQREGLVPIDRLIRARRDRHEAEHQALMLTGALHHSTSRAAFLAQLLETL